MTGGADVAAQYMGTDRGATLEEGNGMPREEKPPAERQNIQAGLQENYSCATK